MIEKLPHLPVSDHWLPNLMKANVEVKRNLIQQFFEKHVCVKCYLHIKGYLPDLKN